MESRCWALRRCARAGRGGGVLGLQEPRQCGKGPAISVTFARQPRCPRCSWVPAISRCPRERGGATPAVLLRRSAVFVPPRSYQWPALALEPAACRRAFGVLIYLAPRRTTLPYFSAKLLLSLEEALTGSCLLRHERAAPRAGICQRRSARSWASIVLALRRDLRRSESSGRARMRCAASPVDGTAFASELSSLRAIVRGHSAALGADQWSPEWLRGWKPQQA